METTMRLERTLHKPTLSPKKQRPQQSLKRRAEPPKPEQKVNASEAKVAKAPVRTSGGADSTAGSSRKPETKKQEEEKKPAPPTTAVEPPLQGGHYELNSRMTKMVEVELRDIMIKVWHELPDNASDEAEALVIDKLRNQAGDDLRNVLGLNITKRLLNVHNPLYVKVQFSGKPEKVHLGEFLKKYNFTAFKRIEKTVNMFAAQVKTINDFDKICSAKDIKCGEIKVTVSPIYKFTKCPPNLVTSFNDQDEDASDGSPELNDKEDKLEEKTENSISISPDKVIVKAENVPTKPKIEDTKIENTTKVDKIVIRPGENRTVVNKPAADNKTAALSKPAVANKCAVKSVENKTAAVSKLAVASKAAVKPVENKITPSKPPVENKTPVNTPAVENKTAVNKTPVKPVIEKAVVNKPTPDKPISKPAVQNKTVTMPAAENKPVANKTSVVNKPAVANKPAAANKTVAKPAIEVKKPQVTPRTNDTGNKPPPTPVKTVVKAGAKSTKTNKVDDYDELDDHDILALMSEGIVLDECSGSDEE